MATLALVILLEDQRRRRGGIEQLRRGGLRLADLEAVPDPSVRVVLLLRQHLVAVLRPAFRLGVDVKASDAALYILDGYSLMKYCVGGVRMTLTPRAGSAISSTGGFSAPHEPATFSLPIYNEKVNTQKS